MDVKGLAAAVTGGASGLGLGPRGGWRMLAQM